MRYVSKGYATFFTTRFGHCQACLRQSFAATIAAWIAFGAVLLWMPNKLALSLLGAMAFGLVAIWLLHAVAFAAKVAVTAVDRQGRRRALKLVTHAAGAGALASVPLLLWPSKSRAFCGQCTKNEDCGVGYVCKNTAPVNSDVCNECVKA